MLICYSYRLLAVVEVDRRYRNRFVVVCIGVSTRYRLNFVRLLSYTITLEPLDPRSVIRLAFSYKILNELVALLISPLPMEVPNVDMVKGEHM